MKAERLPEKTLSEQYNEHRRSHMRLALVLGVVILILIAFSSLMGSANITLPRLLCTLFPGVFSGEPLSKLEYSVFINIRLCRVVMALIVGAGLACCGVVMQAITGNAMASPFTTGISSAAGFGAALGIVFFQNRPACTILFAFILAILCTAIVYGISAKKNFTAQALVLLGIAVNYLFSAMNSCLQYFVTKEQLASIVYWTFGSLANAVWYQVFVCAGVFFLAYLYFAAHAKEYNILCSTGDDSAAALGINVVRLRTVSGIVVALLAATLISFTGVIGFVGLVAPHISRYITGSEHNYLIPVSALTGAGLILIADTIGRTILSPITIPVGVVVSLIGVPVFISLILTKQEA